MINYECYTDGSYSSARNQGGIGIVFLRNGEKVFEYSKGFKETTNNRMELLAVIKGLSALIEACSVNLYSDSQYVVDAFNKGWINSWSNNGWKTSSKKEVKNVDLWQELISLCEIHNVNFIKVKGHADNPYNNKCDEIAVEQYKNM